jgi:Ulp1 protease family, C-terminal catalytic domain
MLKEWDIAEYLDKRERNEKYQLSLFFNSFFFAKLNDEKEGFSPDKVTRWVHRIDPVTMKKVPVNIFEQREIYIPINTKNSHWTLIQIVMEARHIYYFDHYCETSSRSNECLYAILNWVESQAVRLRGQNIQVDFERKEWKLISSCGVKTKMGVPKQLDSSSCGIFVCADMYLLWKGEGVRTNSYNMSNINTLRRALCNYIVTGTLIDFKMYSDAVYRQVNLHDLIIDSDDDEEKEVGFKMFGNDGTFLGTYGEDEVEKVGTESKKRPAETGNTGKRDKKIRNLVLANMLVCRTLKRIISDTL